MLVPLLIRTIFLVCALDKVDTGRREAKNARTSRPISGLLTLFLLPFSGGVINLGDSCEKAHRSLYLTHTDLHHHVLVSREETIEQHEAQPRGQPPAEQPPAEQWNDASDHSNKSGSRRKNQIVEQVRSRIHWADASCQIGWSESVSDKSSQAHDIDAAFTRLRWAAREFSRKKLNKSTLQKTVLDAQHDRKIAEQIQNEIVTRRAQAEAQLTASKSAKEDYLEKKLRTLRHTQSNLLPPIPPLVIPADIEHGMKRGGSGCFGGGGNKRAGAEAEIRANQQKKRDEHDTLVASHLKEVEFLKTLANY